MLVFVIPIIVSITLASTVMAQILQDPGRGSEGPTEYITIVGLESSYTAPADVAAYVHVTHNYFDCGDLYIEVRQQGAQAPILQEGFFSQCFASTNTMIPIGNGFVTMVSQPGTYELVATIQDTQKRNSVSVSEVFTVN